MEIDKYISQQIVNEIYTIIEKNINIMDVKGVVIASTNPKRIGTIHKGELRVIQEKQTVMITPKDITEDVKEGVNLPIAFQGQVIGVVGITGTCEEVEKYGSIVKKISEILVKESSEKEYKKSIQDMNVHIIGTLLYGATYEKHKIKQLAKYTRTYSHVPRYVMLVRFDTDDTDDTMMDLHMKEARFSHRLNFDMGHIDRSYFFGRVNEGLLISVEGDGETQARSVTQMMTLLGYQGGGQEVAFKIGISTIYTNFWDLEKAYKQAKIASEVAFFKCNCSINGTAAKLYIHKNTLQYRLNKVKELTGYDPRDFIDGTKLYIALKLTCLIG